ncbi:GH32 C-terminal domain-containing protein [Corynebacterium breve]|uniref:beta-fructofuranosidase n=1 Tax=Corynebacterium breve TaxID=3049799 RepID=A0ABY8VK12_9CORY|nr:GH32 C-terminal domain-containing protein [Corynebacterium breve]WIM68568.1 GH32 C-terminal domain-containing protein [Corynebacterium breve]
MTSLRPELHVTAENGILEAAAGMLRDGDNWHMLYQYRPAPDQPARWGHQMSEEGPFDWMVCPDVIAPKGGEIDVLAGSVVADNGGADLFFTSVTAAGTSVQIARVDEVDRLAEVTEDPLALDPSVHRVGVAIADSKEFSRFRSPCVIPDWESADDRDQGHSGWLMVTSSGESDAPVPVVLESPDGKDWELLDALTFVGDTGLPDDPIMVSPRIIRLRDEVDQEIYDLLLLTLERDGLDHSGYIVGQLSGAEFTVATPFQRVDFGHDFTRPRNTNLTAGTVSEERRYAEAFIFGLFNGIGRGDDATTQPSWEAEGWANTLSLPRVVTLQGGKLYQTPARGLPDAIAASEHAKFWTALCEIPSGAEVRAEIIDGDDNVVATVVHSGDQLSLDRGKDAPATAPLADDDEDNISIVVDGNTLEVYAGGGAVVMASRIWPHNGIHGIRVRASEDATIHSEWRRGN